MKEKIKVGLLLTLGLLYCLLMQYVYNYIFDVFILFFGFIATFEFAQLQTKSGYPNFKFSSETIFILSFLTFVACVMLGVSAEIILLIELVLFVLCYVVLFVSSAFVFKNKTKQDEFLKITNMTTTEFALFKTNNSFISVLYPSVFFLFLGFMNHIQDVGFHNLDENTAGVPMGLFALVLLFAISCLTDTFAMIFGSLIKGKKLCPKISPKKTISGAVSGLVGGTLGSVAVYFIFSAIFPEVFAVAAVWQFIVLGLVASVVAQTGDLFESFSKRRAGVKESGDLFKSHGGVLDRLDSIIFNIPVVFVSILFIFS